MRRPRCNHYYAYSVIGSHLSFNQILDWSKLHPWALKMISDHGSRSIHLPVTIDTADSSAFIQNSEESYQILLLVGCIFEWLDQSTYGLNLFCWKYLGSLQSLIIALSVYPSIFSLPPLLTVLIFLLLFPSSLFIEIPLTIHFLFDVSVPQPNLLKIVHV